MAFLAIASVTLDSSGRLFVAPEAGSDGSCEYIYREATGVRWDKTLHAFHAHEELLGHIASTVRSFSGEQLRFTGATAWPGVTAELQARL
jgi:hypothetical protein